MKKLLSITALAACLSTLALAYNEPQPLGPGTAAANMGFVSVTAPPYNADPTGATDSTAGVQEAVSENTVVYIPPGSYKLCGVTLPTTANFTLFGAGYFSIIVQGNCGSPALKWATGAMSFNQQVVRDLGFNAAAGTANTIDTTGQGTLTLSGLFFNNTPTGYSNIYVNGAAGVYTHDVQISNIRAYNIGGGNVGYAKVRFGPLGADSSINQMYANGNFTDLHSIVTDPGTVDIQVYNSHVFNTSGNVVLNQGTGNVFNNDTFDFALSADTFHNQGANHTTISGGFIQLVKAGYSGISSAASNTTLISDEQILGEAGAVSAIKDDSSSFSTTAVNIDTYVSTNFSALFDLQGNGSSATRVPGYAPLGLRAYYGGVTTTAQAQATTSYLGQLGGAANYLNTAFTVGLPQIVTGASVAVDTTPAAGQSMTFTLYDGATSLGSCTVNNGGFGCNITANAAAAVNDSLYIKSVFSATSGSANVRYTINYRG